MGELELGSILGLDDAAAGGGGGGDEAALAGPVSHVQRSTAICAVEEK